MSGWLLEAHVATGNGHIEGAARIAHALDGLRELPVGRYEVSRRDGKRVHHLIRRGGTKGGYWNEVSDRGTTKYGQMRGMLPKGHRKAMMPPARDPLCRPETSGS